MGKTAKVKFIVRKARDKRFLAPWRIRTRGQFQGDGWPSTENLARWRDAFNESLRPGGANEHLGVNYWLQCNLEIFDQENGEVVATYQAPMFEALPSFAKNWTGVDHTPPLGSLKNFNV